MLCSNGGNAVGGVVEAFPAAQEQVQVGVLGGGLSLGTWLLFAEPITPPRA